MCQLALGKVSLYNSFVSKKYKGKECAYCAYRSTCRDHVIAREFFLPQHRNDLPAVPACDACNHKKSVLEHYVTVLLPFGGRHTSAQANLHQVWKRLIRNQRLRDELGQRQGHVWAQDHSGLMLQMMTLPVDAAKLLALFRWITRGSAHRYWVSRRDPG